jgi:hypothetical protein
MLVVMRQVGGKIAWLLIFCDFLQVLCIMFTIFAMVLWGASCVDGACLWCMRVRRCGVRSGVCAGSRKLWVWGCIKYGMWVCGGGFCFLVLAVVGMAVNVGGAVCRGVEVVVCCCGRVIVRWIGGDGGWVVVVMGACAVMLSGRGVPMLLSLSVCLASTASVMGVLYSCANWWESQGCFCVSDLFCLKGWGGGGGVCLFLALLWRRGCFATSPVCSSSHICDPPCCLFVYVVGGAGASGYWVDVLGRGFMYPWRVICGMWGMMCMSPAVEGPGGPRGIPLSVVSSVCDV